MIRHAAFAAAPVLFRNRTPARACASSRRSVSVHVDKVLDRSAAISWPGAGAGPFRVQYGEPGTAADSLRSTTQTFVNLGNLSPGTDYEASIAGVGTVRFKTTGCVAEPESETAGAVELPLTELSRLEVRVGKIIECDVHPDADTLYVEKIDCGEEEPRIIVSGLVKYVSSEDLVGRTVVVLCNLKPRAMRGVTSFGMLMCASNEDHTEVDPLTAPEGAKIGELITFDGHKSAPIDAGNRASKAFDRVASELTAGEDGIARYQDAAFSTSAGPCFSPAGLKGSVS